MFLEEITNDIQLESDKFETKSILNRDDIISWLKTIAGFANANGGVFYIGVEDKTNKLIGFDRTQADNERNYFNNQVNEHITPRPQMKISFLRYTINNCERYIIKIVVEESLIKPIILKYKNIPSIFMRRDGFTNGATYGEIINMSIKSKNIQYDSLDSGVKYDINKFSELLDFYQKHNDGNLLTEKKLLSLGITNSNNFLLNGSILFTDDYSEKKTEIQCSVFSGFNKGSERIITINKFNGNIIRSLNYALDFINQRMNHSIVKLNNTRINIDSFPQRAVFEGLINAIAHRDYYLDGTQIQIDIFKDRLEISSPGGFYNNNKIGKTYDLSGIISQRRNNLISNILVACNVMEAAGTGFDKIAEDYSTADLSHKPYIYSTSDHFTLVLPDLTYKNGIEDNTIPVVSFMPVEKGTEFDSRILSFCYYKAHKISEIVKFLKISNSSYFRKQVIENLVNNSYLIMDKISGVSFYKTNSSIVHIE